MFQIEDDILMRFRFVMIGVNDDNDDDNDMYIAPFFQRKFQSFFFISFALKMSLWSCEKKVLFICFYFFQLSRKLIVQLLSSISVVRKLNDKLHLEKLNLETPVSVLIHPL